jgi:DNA sulfur modification protein DndD
VIFHALTLDGVGPYAGRQTLDFAHDERRPVTLVGGLNGSGKTTLIRSLFQVLYGARSLPELGKHSSYRSFLAESVNNEREEAALELSLTVPGLRDDAPITVRRRWRTGTRRGGEELDVFVGDSYDEELSESWDETIEQIAPLGVARLFFFDGEKIEALADLESAADSLRTAVGSLLGLDLVSQLQTDLVAVQRRALRGGDAVSSAKLEKLQADLSAAERLASTAKQRRGALERELEVAEGEHQRLQSASRLAGGDLIAEREKLEAESDEAGAVEAAAWEQLRELAADPVGPLGLVPSLLGQLTETAAADRRGRVGHEVLAVLDERDRWLLAETERLGLGQPGTLGELLAADRDSRRAEKPEVPFAPSSSPEAIEAINGERLTDWRAAAIHAIDAVDEALERTDDIDRRIAKIPHDDSVTLLIGAVDESRAQLDELSERLEVERQLHSAAESGVEAARAKRDAELSRLADAEDGAERHQRVTQHAERAKATLGLLRTRIAERHVGRISDYTLQCLEQLLRKDRLVEQVKIDAETFAVTLTGAHGRLHPGALSAGERQLTALSLLWALARAAGRPLPVVIDTPLGRLDAGHRQHVVERYLPAASHQVVVLSTDTEIDADLHQLLRPSLGAQRRLEIDSAGRTEIVEGYLETAVA